jgi:hypothetical protein
MKALSWSETETFLRAALPRSELPVEGVVLLLVATECAVGGLILLVWRWRWPLVGGVSLVACFLAWSVARSLQGESVECACFGTLLVDRVPPLVHVARTAGILALGLAAMFLTPGDEEARPAARA